jgi:hypothetical protein
MEMEQEMKRISNSIRDLQSSGSEPFSKPPVVG